MELCVFQCVASSAHFFIFRKGKTMKKGLKRFLSAFLSLVIVFGLLSYLPVSSFAVTSGYYEYAVNKDGTATITDYTGTQTDLVIPSTIGGYKITSIGDSAFSD